MAAGRTRQQNRQPEQPLTPEQAEAAAHNKALDLLAGRDYGADELYRKLCDRFEAGAAASVVARLVQVGLLDDERYALGRARMAMQQHKSRREARQLLTGRGLDRELVDRALDAVWQEAAEEGDDPDLQAARTLLARKYRAKVEQGRPDLAAAALLRKGFGFGTVRRALRELDAELPEE